MRLWGGVGMCSGIVLESKVEQEARVETTGQGATQATDGHHGRTGRAGDHRGGENGAGDQHIRLVYAWPHWE